jgi:chemotaxis signal transduction protein
MVGVDALSVRSIRPPRDGDQPVDLGQFLRIEGQPPPRDASKRRVIEPAGAQGTLFSIDNALGTRTLGLADVQPLSRVLESHGAPRWWIGTVQLEGEMVLLVDLTALAAAQRGTA